MKAGLLFSVMFNSTAKRRDVCKSYGKNKHRCNYVGYAEVRQNIKRVLFRRMMRKSGKDAEIIEMLGKLKDNHRKNNCASESVD